MALKPKIQALIDYANETTKVGDVLLGDAVKTLADGYQEREEEVEGTFMQRTTAGELSIKDGSQAKVVSLKGNTWVRNQNLAPRWLDNPALILKNGVFDVSVDGDELIFGIGGTDATYGYINADLLSGHKYLMLADFLSEVNGAFLNFTGNNSATATKIAEFQTLTPNKWTRLHVLYSVGGGSYRILWRHGQSSVRIKNSQLIDLTQWFGAGNEPATALEFANRLGYSSVEDIPYMEYNPGEVVGVNHQCLPPLHYEGNELVGFGVEERGANLCDDSILKSYGCTKEGDEWYINSLSKVSGSTRPMWINANRTPGVMTLSFKRKSTRTDYSGLCLYALYTNGTLARITPSEYNTEDYSVMHGYTDANKTISLVYFSYGSSSPTYVKDIFIAFGNFPKESFYPYREPSLLPINTSNFPYGMHGINGVQDEHTPIEDTRRIDRRAYQSGDESNASVMTDGTYTFYPLATPIITPCDDPMEFEAYNQGTEEVVGSDAPISLNAIYKPGVSLQLPIPPETKPLSRGLSLLINYANEVTGAGDTRMGDAIRTLCEGYGIEPGTMTFYPSAFSAEFSTIASSAITGVDNPIGKGVENGIIGSSTNANWRSPSRASGYTKCTYLFDCSAIPRGAHITGVSCRWQGRQAASRGGTYYASLTISGVECSDPSAIPYRASTASIAINTMANIAALTREDLGAIGISCFTMNTSTQTNTIHLYGAELTISYE